jgi:hypothetical protein
MPGRRLRLGLLRLLAQSGERMVLDGGVRIAVEGSGVSAP